MKSSPVKQRHKGEKTFFRLTKNQHLIIQHNLPRGFSLQPAKMTLQEVYKSRELANKKRRETIQSRKRQKREDSEYGQVAPPVSSNNSEMDVEMRSQADSRKNQSQFSEREEQSELSQEQKPYNTEDRQLQTHQSEPEHSKKGQLQVEKETDEPERKQDEKWVRVCSKIIDRLWWHSASGPFAEKVDEQLHGAPDYYKIISHPMDLGTVSQKLENKQYKSAGQFHRDVQQVWKNSYKYNEDGSQMYKLTQQIHKFYNDLCSGKQPLVEPPRKKRKKSRKRK